MYVGIVTLATFLLLVAIMGRTAPVAPAQPEDARVLLHIAHHDIWWAKSQAWTGTHWALLLIAGIVGAATLFHDPKTMKAQDTWPFMCLIVVSGIVSVTYLVLLMRDMAVNRVKADRLERYLLIDSLRRSLGIEPPNENKSPWRGMPFLILKLGAVLVAVLIALCYLGNLPWTVTGTALVAVTAGCAGLYVRRAAA